MFGGKCQKCGQGNVRGQVQTNIQVSIPIIHKDGTKDMRFYTVEEGLVGVCEHCGEEHYNVGLWNEWVAEGKKVIYEQLLREKQEKEEQAAQEEDE